VIRGWGAGYSVLREPDTKVGSRVTEGFVKLPAGRCSVHSDQRVERPDRDLFVLLLRHWRGPAAGLGCLDRDPAR